MNHYPLMLGALMLLTLGGCDRPADNVATTTQRPAITDVSAASATAAPEGSVLLDVRTPEEFAAGHIDGALNINIAAPDFAAQVAQLDRDKTYLVHCSKNVENGRSAQALTIMQQLGFKELRNVVGGYSALQQVAAAH